MNFLLLYVVKCSLFDFPAQLTVMKWCVLCYIFVVNAVLVLVNQGSLFCPQKKKMKKRLNSLWAIYDFRLIVRACSFEVQVYLPRGKHITIFTLIRCFICEASRSPNTGAFTITCCKNCSTHLNYIIIYLESKENYFQNYLVVMNVLGIHTDGILCECAAARLLSCARSLRRLPGCRCVSATVLRASDNIGPLSWDMQDFLCAGHEAIWRLKVCLKLRWNSY